MNKATARPAPHSKVSRTLAVYASLWLLAAATGARTNGTLLLTEIFAILTLTSVGRFIITETKAATPERLTRPGVLLYLVAWFLCLAVFAFAPFWMNLLAFWASSRFHAD